MIGKLDAKNIASAIRYFFKEVMEGLILRESKTRSISLRNASLALHAAVFE
jgi:hypothetical protein